MAKKRPGRPPKNKVVPQAAAPEIPTQAPDQLQEAQPQTPAPLLAITPELRKLVEELVVEEVTKRFILIRFPTKAEVEAELPGATQGFDQNIQPDKMTARDDDDPIPGGASLG